MKQTALVLAIAASLLVFEAMPSAEAATSAPTSSADPANPPANWNLTTLYADGSAWDASRAKVIAQFPAIKALQGTLGENATSLLNAMRRISDARREVARLEAYAQFKGDENTRIAANAARTARGKARWRLHESSGL